MDILQNGDRSFFFVNETFRIKLLCRSPLRRDGNKKPASP